MIGFRWVSNGLSSTVWGCSAANWHPCTCLFFKIQNTVTLSTFFDLNYPVYLQKQQNGCSPDEREVQQCPQEMNYLNLSEI